jgi:hypothetical protein
MKRGIVIVLVALAAVFGLGACKEVDKQQAGASLVKGTSNLWWFCDGTTLIYFEDWEGSDDEYVALFSWGCTQEGKPTKELPGTLGDGNGGDIGNGDK